MKYPFIFATLLKGGGSCNEKLECPRHGLDGLSPPTIVCTHLLNDGGDYYCRKDEQGRVAVYMCPNCLRAGPDKVPEDTLSWVCADCLRERPLKLGKNLSAEMK
jgi:hypothetical protein